jgi:hypothetical protein
MRCLWKTFRLALTIYFINVVVFGGTTGRRASPPQDYEFLVKYSPVLCYSTNCRLSAMRTPFTKITL